MASDVMRVRLHQRRQLPAAGPVPLRMTHSFTPDETNPVPHETRRATKRTAEGKTPREAQRCLKRYIARQIYRLLQHPKINT